MALKALIFDLGRTIVPFEMELGLVEWSRLSGYGPEEVKRRMVESGLPVRYERGEIATKDFVARIGALLGCEPSHEEFARAWSSIFLPETLIPEAWIERWARDYRLVLLSNTNELHFEFIRERYPILRHFDEYVLSYEVGAMKPDLRIYEAAIAAAQCEAAECFFTDDVEEYAAGAREQGIQAVRFESADQVRRELAARGVHLDQ